MALASVVEPPTVGDSETGRMALAQVIAVGVAVAAEVVEPHDTAGVLVGEGRGRMFRTAGP